MSAQQSNRFQLLLCIGNGTFGKIHEGFDLNTNERVVIKVEPKTCREGYLQREGQQYDRLGLADGFLRKVWYGTESGYQILVLEFLEALVGDIQTVFKRHPQCFTVDVVAAMAVQMIDRIQLMHSRGLIHCDVTPGNFLIRVAGSKVLIYLIDLALSRDWRVEKQLDDRFEGTIYFASVNAIRRKAQSRRDDLESLAYVLIHLLGQHFPWAPLVDLFSRPNPAIAITLEDIAKEKEQAHAEDICFNLPPPFARFLEHARTLDFDEEPHYDEFKQEFTQLAEQVYMERETSCK